MFGSFLCFLITIISSSQYFIMFYKNAAYLITQIVLKNLYLPRIYIDFISYY